MSDNLDVPDELDEEIARALDGHRVHNDIPSDVDVLIGELSAAGTRDEQLPLHVRNKLLTLVDTAVVPAASDR